MKRYCNILLFIGLFACQSPETKDNSEKWKSEIIATEKAFYDMAQKEGLVKAFQYYAAEEGVIKRNRKIIKGKTAISEWYQNDVRPNESLTWAPTFVDVSQSGDLAYTYGDFTFTYLDSLGNEKVNKGIFHTVWKRQKDGSWRFVWD